MLRRKFIALNSYYWKEKESKISLRFHLKNLKMKKITWLKKKNQRLWIQGNFLNLIKNRKKKPIANIVKDDNFLWWLGIRQECPLWPLTQHRIGNSSQCKKIKKERKWIQIRKNKMFSICRRYDYFIENTKEYTKKKKKLLKICLIISAQS